MKREMIKQINEHLDKLKDIDERINDLNKKEKAECMKSIDWILINQAEILEVQIQHTTNEHNDNLKYFGLLKKIMQ